MGDIISGNFFKNNPEKTQTSQTEKVNTGPWLPQQSYLLDAFKQGQTALNSALSTPAYSGPFTAGFNPDQTNAFDYIRNYTTGPGAALGDQITQAGQGGLSANGEFLGNAGNIFSQASGDPTDTLIANATKYANNPGTQGVIDSALKDVATAFGRDNAALNANATGAGTLNSSRTGLEAAAARKDAMDRAASIAANIRNQDYTNGLSTAQNQFNQNIANLLNANNQVGAGADRSLNFATTGNQLTSNNIQKLLDIGTQQQDQSQNEIAGALSQDQYNTNRNLDLINKYMQIIGGNYGVNGTTTNDTYQTHSAERGSGFDSLLGTVLTLAAL